MLELLKTVIEELVDRPQEVEVKEVPGNEVTIFEVRVGGGEAGKVIGKEGKIANSLRTIFKAIGARQQKRVSIEILSDRRGGPRKNGEAAL